MGVTVSAAGLADETGEAARVAFDIAPQSLEAALDVFSATSNVQVLYETSLTSGRRSAEVHGFFTPGAALNALLAGTGLTAWHTTSDSYSLVPQRQDASFQRRSVVGHPPPEIARYNNFLGGVQASFLEALCRSPGTRPGRYRIALSFRIGPSGDIEQTSLVKSTGDPDRDARIIAAIAHVAVGEAPPAELAQPITMVIAPQPPDTAGDCASGDAAGVGATGANP